MSTWASCKPTAMFWQVLLFSRIHAMKRMSSFLFLLLINRHFPWALWQKIANWPIIIVQFHQSTHIPSHIIRMDKELLNVFSRLYITFTQKCFYLFAFLNVIFYQQKIVLKLLQVHSKSVQLSLQDFYIVNLEGM